MNNINPTYIPLGKPLTDEVVAKYGAQIAALASKSLSDLHKELKAIDAEYDKKYESLEAYRRKIIEKRREDLLEERKQVYNLIDNSHSEEERKLFITKYFEICGKLDVLFNKETQKIEQQGTLLIQNKKDKKTKTIIWQVVKTALPVILGAVGTGVAMNVMSHQNQITKK